jgi:hypothetical protein
VRPSIDFERDWKKRPAMSIDGGIGHADYLSLVSCPGSRLQLA